jgi:hypothetical protein
VIHVTTVHVAVRVRRTVASSDRTRISFRSSFRTSARARHRPDERNSAIPSLGAALHGLPYRYAIGVRTVAVYKGDTADRRVSKNNFTRRALTRVRATRVYTRRRKITKRYVTRPGERWSRYDGELETFFTGTMNRYVRNSGRRTRTNDHSSRSAVTDVSIRSPDRGRKRV